MDVNVVIIASASVCVVAIIATLLWCLKVGKQGKVKHDIETTDTFDIVDEPREKTELRYVPPSPASPNMRIRKTEKERDRRERCNRYSKKQFSNISNLSVPRRPGAGMFLPSVQAVGATAPKRETTTEYDVTVGPTRILPSEEVSAAIPEYNNTTSLTSKTYLCTSENGLAFRSSPYWDAPKCPGPEFLSMITVQNPKSIIANDSEWLKVSENKYLPITRKEDGGRLVIEVSPDEEPAEWADYIARRM